MVSAQDQTGLCVRGELATTSLEGDASYLLARVWLELQRCQAQKVLPEQTWTIDMSAIDTVVTDHTVKTNKAPWYGKKDTDSFIRLAPQPTRRRLSMPMRSQRAAYFR